MKFITTFLDKIKTPRYQLSLDSYSYNINLGVILYRFKVYGDPTFVKFTYSDIQSNTNILYDINPLDLIKIIKEEYILSEKKLSLNIIEIRRDNKYKISGEFETKVLSGDEICENILIMKRINHLDLYKIAYSTGFKHGRQLGKEIFKGCDQSPPTINAVFSLKIIK